MPKYKLSYFNFRGRGELSRMVLAAAGQEFEDNRIESDDWPKKQAEMPQGTMPVLEVDGKQKISQSMSIVRFLAREFNLYGKKNSEMAIVDQILDTVVDMFNPLVSIMFIPDEAEKAKKLEEYKNKTLPKMLGFLEALVIETGQSGFAVGCSEKLGLMKICARWIPLSDKQKEERLTVADLALHVYIQGVQTEESLDGFPRLKENRKKVSGLPRIAKYLDTRPVTMY